MDNNRKFRSSGSVFVIPSTHQKTSLPEDPIPPECGCVPEFHNPPEGDRPPDCGCEPEHHHSLPVHDRPPVCGCEPEHHSLPIDRSPECDCVPESHDPHRGHRPHRSLCLSDGRCPHPSYCRPACRCAADANRPLQSYTAPESRNIPESRTLPESRNIPESRTLPESRHLPESRTLPESRDLPEGRTLPKSPTLPENPPSKDSTNTSKSTQPDTIANTNTFNPTININTNSPGGTTTPSTHSTPAPTPAPTKPSTSDVRIAFAEAQTPMLIRQGSKTTVLTIPPFSTTGQIVKLDSMVQVEATSLEPFHLEATLFLVRDGSTICSIAQHASSKSIAGQNENVLIVPHFTWVDVPPPGTHTYEVQVGVYSMETLQVAAESRALTATLFPASDVLPSKNM